VSCLGEVLKYILWETLKSLLYWGRTQMMMMLFYLAVWKVQGSEGRVVNPPFRTMCARVVNPGPPGADWVYQGRKS
jgi:hypothetical protein